MKNNNERISLWILEQERQKNLEKEKNAAHKSQPNAVKEKNLCLKCRKTFEEPKLVQYFACPHCLSKVEEKGKTGCQHWFGFLSQKDKNESVPLECVECEKVMDCMLNQYYDSKDAVSEIEKWY